MSIDEALARAEVRIHEYGDGPNVHKKVGLAVRRRRRRLRRRRPRPRGRVLLRGQHAPADGAARGRGPVGGRRQAHALVVDADAALRPPRAGQGPRRAGRAHPRDRRRRSAAASAASSIPFAHEIAACKLSQLTGRPVKIALTREEVFYIHRGRHPVLMWIKTGFTKDGDITGIHFRPGSTAARTAPTASPRRSTPAFAPDRDLQDAGATSSRARASSPTSRRAGPSAATARRSRASRSSARSTRPPSSSASIPPRCGGASCRAVHQDRQPPHRHDDRARRVHRQGGRGLGLARGRVGLDARRAASRSGPRARDRHRVLGVHHRAPAPRSTGTTCRTPASCRAPTAAAAWPFCGATDIGQGSDSILAYLVAEVLGIEPEGHPRRTRPTPTSRRWTSARTPRA